MERGRKDSGESEKRYITSPDYLLRDIAGDSILVCVGECSAFGNSMISLNETSSFLWKLFETPRTISEAVEETEKVYEDPEHQIEQHIIAVVQEYVRLGLMQEEE